MEGSKFLRIRSAEKLTRGNAVAECFFSRAVCEIVVKEAILHRRKFHGYADDYLNNPKYADLYRSEDGREILELVKKYNAGGTFSSEEWAFLSDERDPTSKIARFLVGIGVEIEGKKTSLATIRQEILRELAEQNERLKRNLSYEKSFVDLVEEGFEAVQTPLRMSDERNESVAQGNMGNVQAREVLETALTETEKQKINFLQKMYEKVYPGELRIRIYENLSSGGFYGNGVIGIPRNKLELDFAGFVESFLAHEPAHHEEKSPGDDGKMSREQYQL